MLEAMLRYINYIIVFLATTCLTISCQLPDRLAIMGDYTTYYTDKQVEFTDMNCSVELKMRESFKLMSVENTTQLALTFYFTEPFEFPSMTLEYEVKAKGDWQIKNDTLSISLSKDLDNIEYRFLKSNATTATQESMVRNIRGMLAKDFEEAKENPEKSAFIVKYCNTKARILSLDNKEMTLSTLARPDILIVKKKEK